MDEEQVREFQAKHHDHLGRRLSVDGVLGPLTRWAVALSQHHPRRQQIIGLASALCQLDIVERPPGSNAGDPRIEAWLLEAGANPGDPWCAAAVSGILSRCGVVHERTPSVQRLVEQFESTYAPLPGDVGYFLRKDGSGHCWIHGGWEDTICLCYEGNSSHAYRACRRSLKSASFVCTVGAAPYLRVPPGPDGKPLPLAGESGTR